MITRYVVLNESAKILMVLRPYQYFAVEAIIDRVKETRKNGFIWHTTGSGKTLTSFKASQILTHMPKVHKVIFVVDRKDLDYQTTKEFNSFSKGSIDGTNNTKTLVQQLAGDNKLIVTTIQKLNTAISKTKYLNQMSVLKDKRVIFIFDECHRSQFGKTHETIKNFFSKCQMFGFTGTPIFEDNAGTNEYGKRTTAMLFSGEKALHKYVITDAIRDENVLKFSIEYINTFKKKEHIIDINVEAIDEKEVMEAPERLNAIADYIIANHSRKTHNKEFTAIMCVNNVETLIKYYEIFKEKEHNLKVATIFSYQANEEDKDALGFTTSDFDEVDLNVVAEPKSKYNSKHTREYLDSFIADYNKTFGTNYSTKDTQSYYNYYNDIAKRVKHKQVDILLVVNMFLTGFDSKTLNTIYVDKNLKYHGLIQAYSRTNRILNEVKSQGNVVCFRNLKQNTDDAITLFSNIESKDEIIIKPYEDYVKKMNDAFIQLLQITPTIDSVSNLESEEDELAFAKSFRELMRTLNVLKTFTEFTFEDISINEQTFEDYKSKYLDLRDKVKRENAKEKVSILNDIDFELELIHRDEINVTYILKLLANLKNSVSVDEKEKQLKNIMDIVAGDTQLRSKRELIEKFINEHLPIIKDSEDIPDVFIQFMTTEKLEAIKSLSKEENLDSQKLEKVIGDYMFTEKIPLRDDIIDTMNIRPSLKERKMKAERITNKILEFVEIFISGIMSN
jgi:type I restriction enzyme R subunit